MSDTQESIDRGPRGPRARAARVRRAAAGVAVAFAALMASWGGPASAAAPPPAPWPQFGGSAAHTGVSPFDGPAPPLRRVWRFPLPEGENRLGGPVVAGGVAVAVGKRHAYGIDVATGKQRWVLPRDGGPIANPAVATVAGVPVLLFTEGGNACDSRLSAWSLAGTTPALAWTVSLPDRVKGGVAVDGDLAVVGDQSGNVVAVSLAGTPARPSPTPSPSPSPSVSPSSGATPTPSGGSTTGATPAPGSTTGPGAARCAPGSGKAGSARVRWRGEVPGIVDAVPAVGQGLVVVSGRSSTTGRVVLEAFSAEGANGRARVLWQYTPGLAAGDASPVTIDGRVLYVGFGDETIVSLDARTRTQLWITRVRSSFVPYASLAIHRGFLLAAATSAFETGLYRIDASTGRRSGPWSFGRDGLWDFDLGALDLLSSPLVVGSHVYLGLSDGRMVAIRESSGVLEWQLDTGPGALHQVVPAGDELIVGKGSRTGGILAFAHDPSGSLVRLESPTKPRWAAMAANYGLAAAIVVGVSVLLFLVLRLLARRRAARPGPRPEPEPEPEAG